MVTLPGAEWVQASKTKIRFLSVEVGSVDEIHVQPDLAAVELHCTLHNRTKQCLTEGAKFRLVRPRLSAGSVTGLDTLLSGAYLAMRPGPTEGRPKRQFVGLESPPLTNETTPGLTVTLHAEELLSLDVGSPVYFREVQVGMVEHRELAKDGSGVELSLFFPQEHADLVREDSRFWSVGGIEASGSLAHFEVQTHPLDAMLSGGIEFDAPRGHAAGAAEKGARFWLHPSRSDVDDYLLRYGGLRIYVDAPQLGSLAIGDHVFYREIPVGAVISRELARDSKRVRVGLNIQSRYAARVRDNSKFWNASGISANLGLHGLQIRTESLESILAGGIAFATPDSAGMPVAAGSVFRLQDQVEKKWLEWSPLILRPRAGGTPARAAKKVTVEDDSGDAEAHSTGEKFSHHANKTREESAQEGEPSEDPTQASGHEAKRHEFFHRLFHRDRVHRDEARAQSDEAKGD